MALVEHGGSRPRSRARRSLVPVLLLALLAACAGASGPAERDLTPALVAHALAAAGAHDERAQFAALVCPRLSAIGRGCGDVLRGQSPDVPPDTGSRSLPPADRPRVVFIAGLFAECLARWVSPFKDVIEGFVSQGYDARPVAVAGRGTAADNAGQIAAALAGMPRDGKPIVVFAYSKGAVDILEALVRHPEATGAVAAIVTIAGAQNGSHLAETRGDFYATIGSALPMSGCAMGSGGEVAELRRDRRHDWWTRHRSAIGVPLYSLVALPRPGRVSPFLDIGRRQIDPLDAHNDGNIIWRDAIAPGGMLLGFVDADHWTIALPLAQELPALAPLLSDDVPRPILYEAALTVAMSRPRVTR